MVKPLNVVVIGLGSMGSRRLRCLKALGHKAVLGVDPRADRRRRAEKARGPIGLTKRHRRRRQSAE